MRHFYTILAISEDGIFSCKDNSSDEIKSIALDYLDCDDPKSLLGKTVSVSYLNPIVSQGMSPRIEDK